MLAGFSVQFSSFNPLPRTSAAGLRNKSSTLSYAPAIYRRVSPTRAVAVPILLNRKTERERERERESDAPSS